MALTPADLAQIRALIAQELAARGELPRGRSGTAIPPGAMSMEVTRRGKNRIHRIERIVSADGKSIIETRLRG